MAQFDFGFDLAAEIKARFLRKPPKNEHGANMRWSPEKIKDALYEFIQDELYDLDRTLYRFYANYSKDDLPFSKSQVHRMSKGESLIREGVDLIFLYLFRVRYERKVELGHLPDRREIYRTLKSEIESQNKRSQHDGPGIPFVDPILRPFLAEFDQWKLGADLNPMQRIYRRASANILDNDQYSAARLNLAYAPIEIAMGHYEQARTLLSNCLDVFLQFDSKADLYATYDLLLPLCLDVEEYAAADSYYQSYIKLVEEQDTKRLADAYLYFGRLKLALYQFNEAATAWKKAKDCGNTLQVTQSVETRKQGALICGHAAFHMARLFKVLDFEGEVEVRLNEAIKNYVSAESELHICMAECDLTENLIYAGRIADNRWKIFIDRIRPYFRKHYEYRYEAKCLQLEARIAVRRGDFSEACKHIETATEIIAKTNNPRDICIVLEELWQTQLKSGVMIEEVFWTLKRLLGYANEHTLYIPSFRASKQLSLMELEPHRTKHLQEVKRDYAPLLTQMPTDIHRSLFLEALADIEAHLGNHDQAILMYEGVQRIYESAGYQSAAARAKLRVIEIYYELDEREKVSERCDEILSYVRGTDFFQCEIEANFFKALVLVADGNRKGFPEAGRAAKAAYEKGLRYDVDILPDVKKLFESLRHLNSDRQPPVFSLEQMLRRLSYSIANETVPYETMLRYWYYVYATHLKRHFSDFVGSKALIFTDKFDVFDNIRAHLSWLFGAFIMGAQEGFDNSKIEAFNFPFDFPEAGTQISLMNNITTEEKHLEALRRTVAYEPGVRYMVLRPEGGDLPTSLRVIGQSLPLPLAAYDFFKRYSFDEILENRSFVLPFFTESRDELIFQLERSLHLGAVLLRVGELPSSSTVRVVHSFRTVVPFSKDLVDFKTIAVQRAVAKLPSLEPNQIPFALEELKLMLKELHTVDERKVPMIVSIIEFPYVHGRVRYPVFCIAL